MVHQRGTRSNPYWIDVPPGRVQDHGAGRGEPRRRPAPAPEPAPRQQAGGAGQRGAEHPVGASGHAETGQTDTGCIQYIILIHAHTHVGKWK